MAEARRLGKTLISFSHYPLVDFTNGSTESIARTFGPSAMNLKRNPSVAVTDIFHSLSHGEPDRDFTLKLK